MSKPEILTASDRMSVLAEAFGLTGKPGVRPFVPTELDKAIGVLSSGEAHAARFMLTLWHSTHKWRSGTFNVVQAFQVWDQPHRDAFLAWVQNPWQP